MYFHFLIKINPLKPKDTNSFFESIQTQQFNTGCFFLPSSRKSLIWERTLIPLPFIKQIFTEHLPHAVHCSRCWKWEFQDEQNPSFP